MSSMSGGDPSEPDVGIPMAGTKCSANWEELLADGLTVSPVWRTTVGGANMGL